MLPAEGRLVVCLFGPPGAGKSTVALEAATASNLAVYDRDHPHWTGEKPFRTALAALADNPLARAVVLRSGATSTARASNVALVHATHSYLLTAPYADLARRIATRDRPDKARCLAGLKPWIDAHDRDDDVEDFPGWDNVPPSPNVTPLPPGDARTAPATTPSRTGRPWARVKARVIRRDAGICHLCGMPGADSADHITPVSAGGPIYAMSNLAAAHLRCNKVRGTREIATVRDELAPSPIESDLVWQW